MLAQYAESALAVHTTGSASNSHPTLKLATFVGPTTRTKKIELAASVGTPPVTLFGPADPDRMCPFGYRHLVVQASAQTCRACNRYPWAAGSPKITCDRAYACMREISTDDILEKALPLLQNKEQNLESL